MKRKGLFGGTRPPLRGSNDVPENDSNKEKEIKPMGKAKSNRPSIDKKNKSRRPDLSSKPTLKEKLTNKVAQSSKKDIQSEKPKEGTTEGLSEKAEEVLSGRVLTDIKGISGGMVVLSISMASRGAVVDPIVSEIQRGPMSKFLDSLVANPPLDSKRNITPKNVSNRPFEVTIS